MLALAGWDGEHLTPVVVALDAGSLDRIRPDAHDHLAEHTVLGCLLL
jgi:hypothetical protein